jgi:putative oxidoreductase
VSVVPTIASDHDSSKTDVLDWVLRVAVAFFFLVFGAEKVFGASWIPIFDAIGLGQWFRYATGAMQIVGALLIAAPRTALVGAAFVGSTMAGAIVCHLVVLDTGVGGAIIPGIFLGFVVAAASRRLVRRTADVPLVLR